MRSHLSVQGRGRARVFLSAFYFFAVFFGGLSFILWGCYCDDEENGYPNKWNRVYLVKTKITDPSYYVHTCSIGFAAFLGLEWCVALGVLVSLNLATSVPVLVFLVYYYGWWDAFTSLLLGAGLSVGFAAFLLEGIAGLDPPPGFGLDGVPVGACITSGNAVMALWSLGSAYGYRQNQLLGVFMQRTVLFFVGSVMAGVYVSFSLHLALGFFIPLDLLAAAGFATQVYMVEGAGVWTCSAFALPLLLGGVTSVALEMSGLSLPPMVGSGVGLAVSFMVVAPLSWFFESRGVAGAAAVAATALLQDIIFVSAAVAADHLSVASGGALGGALEVISAVTVWVYVKVGPDFGMFTGGYSMLVLLGFTPLLVYVQSFGWPLSLLISCGTAAAECLVVGVAMVYFGMVNGLRAVFVMFLTVLHANLLLLAVVTFGLPVALTVLANAGVYLALLGVLLLGLQYDDGAGWLYGSGIEVLGFVCAALFVGYATGTVLGLAVPTLDAATALLAGVTTGGLVLLCPVVTRALVHKQHARLAIRSGLRVAVLLDFSAAVHVTLVHALNGVSIGGTVRLLALYSLGYVLLMALAVVRFKTTLLVVYLVWLGMAATSIALAFLHDMDWGELMTLCSVCAFATTGELFAVRQLSAQRAAQREDVKLDDAAVAVRVEREARAETKRTKPREPRAKHAAKAARLSAPGTRLPSISELSFNGVLERSGVVDWCEANGTTPNVPWRSSLIVARGSFYYLFPPSSARMPSERALGSFSVFGARGAMHPTFHHPTLGELLENLLFVHLSIPWGAAGKNFFFKLRSRREMREWHADLQTRAQEKSAATAQRKAIRRDAAAQDPQLSPGYELLRKDRAPSRRGVEPKLRTLEVMGGHYIYTPRGLSGTAEDQSQHYELEPRRRKSLAKSAREAMEANQAHDAEEKRKLTQGGAGSYLRAAARGMPAGPAICEGGDDEIEMQV